MKKIYCSIDVLGNHFKLEVDADTVEEAQEKLFPMSIADFLSTYTVGDVCGSWGFSTTPPKEKQP